MVLWGLFKKVVVADGLAASVELLIGFPESYRPLEVVLGLFFFAFMLYGDFSGYSDIAIGTAKIMGFDLMRNFNYPYFARDIMDFWRRWHISLTTWFRDYVFLSLPQGKGSNGRIIFNFIITFTLSGLWPRGQLDLRDLGISAWAVPYSLFAFPEMADQCGFHPAPFYPAGNPESYLPDGGYLGLNLFALVFFVSPNMGHAFRILDRIISPNIYKLPYIIRRRIWLAGAIHGGGMGTNGAEEKHVLQIQTWHPALRWGLYYCLVLLVLYYNYERKAFIYFQF